MTQLSTYIGEVRDLLHDPNGQLWSDATLTGYINRARRRVAQDTYCLRQLNTGIVLVPGQERYIVDQTVDPSFQGRICGVIGIDLYYGNLRYPLFYSAWVPFSRNMRFYTVMRTRPTVFTRQGAIAVYVGYTPDQAYVTDWDLAVVPQDLVNDASVEELVVPFVDVVQWWAAHLAKFKEQAIGESQLFQTKYRSEVLNANRSFQLFVSNPVNFNNAST